MGSRAVVVVCRDAEAARKRFGVDSGEIGACYTRTGRRFFNDDTLELGFLETVREAWTKAGYWEAFGTEWFCLDAELMPWSAKAQDLVLGQYASVGAAARASLREAIAVLEQAKAGGAEFDGLVDSFRERVGLAERYGQAWRRYCWPVKGLSDLKLAPFHLLATEGKVHVDRDHVWHMETLAKLAGGIVVATPFRVVDVTNPESRTGGAAWWTDLTGKGGEGMVVKPREFVARGRRGLLQPAVKCRGPEYLRIIYGPEYTLPANLERLRSRGLGAKRSLALREFSLGIEGLERFTRREPLRRAHECVFGVLALESEPVDPRL